jgi:hypothetical protein
MQKSKCNFIKIYNSDYKTLNTIENDFNKKNTNMPSCSNANVLIHYCANL